MSEHPPKNPSLEGENEILQLKNYEAVTDEQYEALQRIAEIDEKIAKLDIISNSLKLEYEGPSPRDLEDSIRSSEDALEDAKVAGTEVEEIREELSNLRSLHEETTVFYAEQGNSMLRQRHSYEDKTRIMGVSEENFSESTSALIDALEKLGLPRERFVEAIKGMSGHGPAETEVAKWTLEKFRSELMLQRNTERLTLPDGIVEMSAELTKATKADEIDYEKTLFPHGKNISPFSEGQARVSQVFEALPFNDRKIFSEYPTEVQERFYARVARGVLASTGDETAYGFRDKAAALGKDLSELRIYGAERFRSTEDIEFDIQKFEKVLEYAKAEEEYLGSCFKDDQLLRLSESVQERGVQYNPDKKDEWVGESPAWPIVSFDVNYDVEKIQQRGNIRLKEYDAAARYKGVMHEALQILLAENPRKSKIGAIDVIVAMRKATERVKLELDMVQAEKDQAEMHTTYLQNLKTKTVTL
jgi:hypothetical protein